MGSSEDRDISRRPPEATPPAEGRRFSNPITIAVVTILMAAVSVLGEKIINSEEPPLPQAPPPGCLTYGDWLNTDVGEPLTVEAAVDYGLCIPGPDITLDEIRRVHEELGRLTSEEERAAWMSHYAAEQQALRTSRDKSVGGKAHLSLVSPSFPGTIGTVTAEDQKIEKAGDKGTWVWDIKPSEPGLYELKLVLTITTSDGQVIVNELADVHLFVDWTVLYYVGKAWAGIVSFLTSLQGLVVGIVAAIAAVIGLVPHLRRRKSSDKKDMNPTKSGDTTGYM